MIDPLVTGGGLPVTLFVGGLGQDAADLRVFGSGVVGSRVFQPLIGTDGRDLVADVSTVRGLVEATQALGVSLGASVLLSAVSERPQLLQRLVLAMPAHADRPRSPKSLEVVADLREALTCQDQTAIMAALLAMQPASVRERLTVKMWARRQAAAVASMNLIPLIDRLSDALPPTADAMRAIDVPVLVIAQRDDPMHPVDAAERLAELLPHAELVVSDVPWVWSARDQLRERVAAFLA